MKDQCETRNRELANENGLNIDVDQEILAIINASTMVATQKGSSVNLLKVGSKRRRTRAEMEELQRLEEEKAEELARREEEIARLNAELADARERLEVTEHSHVAISQMIEGGYLSKTKEGNLELVPRL